MTTPKGGSRGARLTLLSIAGIPITMILAATWLWYFVSQGHLDLVSAIGTSNNGTLMDPPRQIKETIFADDAGAPFKWADVEPKWTMVIPHQGDECDRACERLIYTSRQIHISLGKEFNRVRRVMVNTAPITQTAMVLPEEALEGWPDTMQNNTLLDYILASQKGMLALQVGDEEFKSLFPQYDAAQGHWYLVDPAGWVMMRFDTTLDYKAVLADLKFLLKNSAG